MDCNPNLDCLLRSHICDPRYNATRHKMLSIDDELNYSVPAGSMFKSEGKKEWISLPNNPCVKAVDADYCTEYGKT